MNAPQHGTSPHNASSRQLFEKVCSDARAGNGALDDALRAAVFTYASARSLSRSTDKPTDTPTNAALSDDVRAFVDAVLTRAISADVDALKRNGRSEDFIYELAIVAAVAAGSARGRAGFALLKTAAS